MPHLLFDSHLHLVADDTQRYPRVAHLAPPPGAPVPDPLPPGTSGQPGGGAGSSVVAVPDVTRVLEWMDDQGVEGGVAVQKRGTYGFDNSYILDSTDLHGDRLVPVVVLDAEDPKTPQRVRELIERHGLAAVRLTGTPTNEGAFPWLNSPAVLETWAVAESVGLVVDVMVMPRRGLPSGIEELARLAHRYPHVRVVLDHAGLPDLRRRPDFGIDGPHRTLAQAPNVYCKVTTLNLDLLREAQLSASEFIQRLLTVYGSERVMWGSDLGNSAGDYRQMVSRILVATEPLRDAERSRILHGTGKGVFVRGGHR